MKQTPAREVLLVLLGAPLKRPKVHPRKPPQRFVEAARAWLIARGIPTSGHCHSLAELLWKQAQYGLELWSKEVVR